MGATTSSEINISDNNSNGTYTNHDNLNISDNFDDVSDIENTPEYSEQRLQQLKSVQREAFALFERKNRDYGDAFANYGVVGVLVRIGDKIQRALSITKNGVTMVDNESVRDTLIDLANYASMAVVLLDELDESS
jgi:hypothetical protein